MTDTDKADVFAALRPSMARYADSLVVVSDEEDDLYLDTRHIGPNGKPLFFGAIQVRKNYVSYHLMPVYVNPALLDGISEALRRRMQGKSCFNFRRVDRALFEELDALTEAGFRDYAARGFVAKTSGADGDA